jgi:hypothetical protein
MQISYTLFADPQTQKASETESAVVYKLGSARLMKLGKVETLTTEKYSITVDNDEKLILVNKNSIGKSGDLPIDLDSLAKFITNTRFTKEGGKGIYKLGLKAGEYESVEIEFNTATYLISKLTLYLRNYDDKEEGENRLSNKPRLELSITDFTTTPVISKTELLETKYVRIQGQDVRLQERYAQYKLVSYIK